MKKILDDITARNKFLGYSLVSIYFFWKFLVVSIGVYLLITNGYPWLAIGLIVAYMIVKIFGSSWGDTDLDDISSIRYKVIRLKNQLTYHQQDDILKLKILQDIELLEFRISQLVVLNQAQETRNIVTKNT